jgi:hypothetical protein
MGHVAWGFSENGAAVDVVGIVQRSNGSETARVWDNALLHDRTHHP